MESTNFAMEITPSFHFSDKRNFDNNENANKSVNKYKMSLYTLRWIENERSV